MNRNDQGTGKHGHKDTQEPWPHHGQSSGGGGSERHASGDSGRQGGSSEEHSLKEREYRDSQGNVHHHTDTYMEQHGKSGSGRDENR